MTAAQKALTTVVVLIILVGGIYYFSARPAAPTADTTATTTPNGTATSTATTTANSNTGGLKLVQPDYKKPIVFSADISADIRTELNTDLVKDQAEIAANPLDLQAWTNLGNVHKIGGGYANAALYWEYVTTIYTGKGAPFYSLGDLYQNFLHNYTKAEADYKASIEADPQNVNAYASLYTMYHYTLHDDAKAAAILQQGLTANPGNNYLLGLQKELQSQ